MKTIHSFFTSTLAVIAATIVIGMTAFANAASVTWQNVQAISSDDDVDTSGTPVMAVSYSGSSSLTVNGVTFQGNPTIESNNPNQSWWNDAVSTQNGVTADLHAEYINSQTLSFNGTTSITGSISSSYQTLISNSYYSDWTSSSVTFTLTGLTVGQQYLVQFWYADYQSGSAAPGTESITGSSSDTNPPTFGVNNGTGSVVTGVFTATSTTQVFTISSPDGYERINAFQLKAVQGAPVVWQNIQAISSDTDVDTSGTSVMAVSFSANSSTTVNGVNFIGNPTIASNNPNQAWWNDATCTQNGITADWRAEYISPQALSLTGDPASVASSSQAYQSLLSNSYFSDWTLPSTTLTVTGLAVGQQYLVQFWYADYRSGNASPGAESINNTGADTNSPTFGFGNGTGSVVTGLFTATAASQVFTISAPTGYERINAFQLRAVQGSPVVWQNVQAISGDTDVVASGSSVLALSYSTSSSSLTVNGVTFQGNPTISSNNPSQPWWNDAVLTQNGVTADLHAEYITPQTLSLSGAPSSVLSSTPAYQSLVANNYRSNWTSGSVTLSLTGLTAGQQYLVQFWYADYRSGLHIQGTEGISDSGVDANPPTFGFGNGTGSVVTGLFTASSSTQVFTISNPSGYETINAFQLKAVTAPVSQLMRLSNGKSVLYVDGQPFVPNAVHIRVDLGREAGMTNAQMNQYFTWVKGLNANTVDVGISWGDCEPSEGTFNWTNLDWAIGQAQANNLKMEIVWAGSDEGGSGWSKSIPAYIANNPQEFLPELYANGDVVGMIYPPNPWPGPNTLPSNGEAPYYYYQGAGNKICLSKDCGATQWYEERVLINLMNHLAVVDPGPTHTVIGFMMEEPTIVQTMPVPNEIDRDYSPSSSAYWTGNMTPLAFDEWRLSLSLDRIESCIKSCPNSLFTKINFTCAYWEIDESVQAMRTYAPHVDSVGIDPYGIQQGPLWDLATGDLASGGNTPEIGEIGGQEPSAPNEIIDMLAANGTGSGVYQLGGVDQDNNALLSATGTDNTSTATEVRALFATLDNADYYLAVRCNGLATSEINYYNSQGTTVATGTSYNVTKTLNGRSVTYSTSSGGHGVNFLITPGVTSSPMGIISALGAGTFTLTGGLPSQVQLGYYDNAGVFHVQGDSYFTTGVIPYTNEGNGTFLISLNAGEVAQITY